MELAHRELMERHLHDFVKAAWPIVCPEEKFIDGWHIWAICAHLEAVTRGTINKMLINVPPGTMKSLLVCVFWPAWVWTSKQGRTKKFMYASYSDFLTLRDSTKTRDLVTSQWFQTRWHMLLRDDQNTKGLWKNEYGGWRLSTSVGGKGIGEHPDVKVFDDPHNTKQAESDVERQAVLDWWDGTMEMRGAMKNAASVGVMQRLHHLDLSGHVLKKKGWVHICLPMRYEVPSRKDGDPTGPLLPRMPRTPIGWQDPRTEEGELLWPEGYPQGKVDDLEASLGLYNTAGQFQQRPSPKGGGTFQRKWFAIVQLAPALIKIVRYWDKAATPGGTGAETSGTLMASYKDHAEVRPAFKTKYIILEVRTCRKGVSDREAYILQTAAEDRAKWGFVETWVEQEPGSGGKESAENTVGTLAGYACYVERVTGDKQVRATPLSSQSSVGKVSMLAGEWNGKLLDELEAFPTGALKDMVDSTSGAFNKIFVQGEGIRPDQVSTGTRKVEIIEVDSAEVEVQDLTDEDM